MNLDDRIPPGSPLHPAYGLGETGKLNLSEVFIDGSFSGAKKRDLVMRKPNADEATKPWQLQTAMVFLSRLMSQVLRLTK